MRRAWLYPILMAGFVIAILAVLQFGNSSLAPIEGAPAAAKTATAGATDLWSVWRSNLTQPLARLLLQIVLIIVVARGLGSLARRVFGQPSVIGEMAAGIALGPSLFGAIAPDAFAWTFPPESLAFLNVLSQTGVILFLFGVGLEFRWHHVRHQAHTAVVVSNVAIVFPFLLGVIAALALYRGHAPAGTSFQAFALFMGIALSITAFPVLARILSERKMLTTSVGSLALTCAAIDDVTAWVLLAFVVATVTSGGSFGTVFLTLTLTAAFVGGMVLIVRPVARRLFQIAPDQDAFSSERVAAAMALLFACALATEVIGIHALFGAFIAGATLPATDDYRSGLRERLEGFTSVLLLPLFFAFTGLRTQIGLINDWSSVWISVGIILLATIGKLAGSAVAGRLMGLDRTTSFVLGALMNTRGLMQLIALNVGYDLGVISQEIFTILVLMALVTTTMTNPLVDLALKEKRRPA